jgi:membrane protein
MIVIAPILMLATTTLTAALQNNGVTTYLSDDLGLGPVIQGLFRVLPLVMVWLGFAFLYMVMPNTKVPFRSALIGGIVGGTMYQAVQVLYFKFNVGVANYNAIYAGFAAFPIFLVWVYSNWVAVLLGALVAWAHQAEPAYREHRRMTLTSPADRELLAVRALSSICSAFAANRGPTAVAEVAAECNVPPGVMQDILAPLVSRGLLARTDNGVEQGFLPARQLDDVRVDAVLDALRGDRHPPQSAAREVAAVIDSLRSELASSPQNLTLRELTDRVNGKPAPSATRRTS